MGEQATDLTSVLSPFLDAMRPILDRVQDEPWLGAAVLGVVVVALRLVGRRRRRAPRRVPRCRPGEVWFAMVPFEDGTGAKDRPVLVLQATHHGCTAARITSQDRGGRRDFVAVPEGVPGLPKASWISLREVRLHRRSLRRRIGDPGEAFVEWYLDIRADRGVRP